MSMSNVIEFFKANPRATAAEAGITTAEANALVGAGKLIQVGKRVTGKRGRPPYEFVTPDYDVSDDALVQEAKTKATAKVMAHRAFERMSNAIMHAANEFGHGSPEHTEAKQLRAEAFPSYRLPDVPSSNDYVLAGVIDPEMERDLDAPEGGE